MELTLRNHRDITEDMWLQIDEIIATYKDQPGALIAVLRECQNVVGYLPVQLMDAIGEGLGVPPSEVFAVASFYSLFSMTPKGRHMIRVCTGTACYVKGIKEVLHRIQNAYDLEAGGTTEDRRFSLESVRCLGACGLAPVMMVDDRTYGAVKSDAVLSLLESYE
jgi:NADH:ubiquinone oxidoreductase subunit E